MIKEELRTQLVDAKTLPEVANGIVGVLSGTKSRFPDALVWYVSGMITSEGPEHIARNIAALERHTEEIRAIKGPHVFSPTDVFSDELFVRIDATGARGQDYMDMWRVVLESGMVHGVFFTPRWKKSLGARDEYTTAQRNGLIIIDMDKSDII